jgi:hypothetical protein
MITLMPNRASILAKRLVQRAARSAGYEITPFSIDFREGQRRLLWEVDLLVDVGNTGPYVELVRQVGYRGPVLSFEPMTDAFETSLPRRVARVCGADSASTSPWLGSIAHQRQQREWQPSPQLRRST